jgi:hypothetical protein
LLSSFLARNPIKPNISLLKCFPVQLFGWKCNSVIRKPFMHHGISVHVHPCALLKVSNLVSLPCPLCFECGYPTRRVRVRVSFFTHGSDPHPPRESAGAGVGFIFHPWISEILNFNGFDPVSPTKILSASKFWLSPILSTTQVPYHNPR